MKTRNKIPFAFSLESTWTEDADGFLRVPARVLVERILPYANHEVKNLPDRLKSQQTINTLVSKAEFERPETLKSLEGTALVLGDHAWLTPEEIHKYQVGSVAGAPRIEDDAGEIYLACDLKLTDPETISKVKNKEMPEISGAYRNDLDYDTDGKTFNSQTFDAIQTGLRFNHIAIIPEGTGRAGRDVKIMNKNAEEAEMSDENKQQFFKVQLPRTQKFVNVASEDDANSITEETKAGDTAAASGVEGVMSELETKTAELEACKKDVEGLKGELEVYKQKIDELMAPERIEAVANEMMEEQEEASEIMENAYDDKDDDEEAQKSMNQDMKKLHGEPLHEFVLGKVGMKTENKSPDEIRGMFKATHALAKSGKGARVVSGEKMLNMSTKEFDAGGIQRTDHQRLGIAAE